MIYEFNSAKDFLAAELQVRVQHNPRYSLRGFARQLKVSPGELSEVLGGKRQLSLKSASKIIKAMGLNDLEARHLVQIASSDKAAKHNPNLAKTAVLEHANRQILQESTFQLLSDWFHFALINLMDCEDFQWDSSWIAKRLGISRTQARLSMDLLLKVGLVRKKGREVRVVPDFVISTDGIPSESIRNYHRQILNKAVQALQEQSPQERDITGVGFALDPKHLPSIKKDIAEFQEKLIAKYSKGSRTQVYHLETTLIRLTEGDTHEK